MTHQTAIIIENGAVTRVYSTIPADEHILEILDMDAPDARDGVEARIEELDDDFEFRKVLG